MIYGNGSYYEGEWSRGKQHGKGLYIDNHGRRFDGTWYEGTMSQNV